MKLKLEFNTNLFELDEKYISSMYADGVVMATPPIDKDYWLFRIPLSDNQAIVAFPKFGTFGVGFQNEEDWNTNLPYACTTKEIFGHIRHNKQDENIPDKLCVEAIKMIQKACSNFVSIKG